MTSGLKIQLQFFNGLRTDLCSVTWGFMAQCLAFFLLFLKTCDWSRRKWDRSFLIIRKNLVFRMARNRVFKMWNSYAPFNTTVFRTCSRSFYNAAAPATFSLDRNLLKAHSINAGENSKNKTNSSRRIILISYGRVSTGTDSGRGVSASRFISRRRGKLNYIIKKSP